MRHKTIISHVKGEKDFQTLGEKGAGLGWATISPGSSPSRWFLIVKCGHSPSKSKYIFLKNQKQTCLLFIN